MKYFPIFLVAVCLTLASPAAAAPLSIKNQTATNNLEAATVNLYCKIKVGNKEVSTTGSGVVIDSKGVILTNAHVAQYFLLNGADSKLKADCSVRTGSPAKEKYTAEVLYISKAWLADNTTKKTKDAAKSNGENDFALLRIKEVLPTPITALPLGIQTQVIKGNEVNLIGYPSGDLNYKGIRNKLKVVSATTTVAGLQTFGSSTTDTLNLSRTKFASSGVSGGPVVLANTVVGILATRSTSKSKEGASLRALTATYISRMILNETGLSVPALYSGDLATRVALTRAGISEKELSAIEKPLRNLRK